VGCEKLQVTVGVETTVGAVSHLDCNGLPEGNKGLMTILKGGAIYTPKPSNTKVELGSIPRVLLHHFRALHLHSA
jgi:hypothetical protein